MPAPTALTELLSCVERGQEELFIRDHQGASDYSFGDIGRAARRHASVLAAMGIGAGDRVALMADASAASVAALIGHYLLGAIHVPVNPGYRRRELAHILRDSGASLFVHDEPALARLRELDGVSIPTLALEAPGRSTEGGGESWKTPSAGDDTPALIIYTSGTTGESKGVVLTHGAVEANIRALTGLWGWSHTDRLSLALPLFHVHGLCIGLHGCLLHGMAMDLHARFEAASVVADVRAGATVFMGVPTMYRRILEHLEQRPEDATTLAQARLFTSGSAPLPATDFKAFESLTRHRILERYGMSETLLTLSNPYSGERRPGSVGLAVPGCDIRVVDEEGRDCAPGQAGELLVRSNGIMREYWGREETTQASFRDGWFLTGDVVQRGPDGYVEIIGRKSVDIIKSGGFKIGAREIEEVIGGVEGVTEVAVFGTKDRTWGEAIAAAVVVDAADGTTPELLDRINEEITRQLADYKRVRALFVLETLPRNVLGKVQKHLLVRAAEAGEL